LTLLIAIIGPYLYILRHVFYGWRRDPYQTYSSRSFTEAKKGRLSAAFLPPCRSRGQHPGSKHAAVFP
jgi:hypothetical protein